MIFIHYRQYLSKTILEKYFPLNIFPIALDPCICLSESYSYLFDSEKFVLIYTKSFCTMIRNSNRVKLHLLRKVAWYSPLYN